MICDNESINFILTRGWTFNIDFYIRISTTDNKDIFLSTSHKSIEDLCADNLLNQLIDECKQIAQKRLVTTNKEVKPCIQFRNNHIGHFIWNDLNGLSHLKEEYEEQGHILEDISKLEFLENEIVNLSDNSISKAPRIRSRKEVIDFLLNEPYTYIFASVNRRIRMTKS